MARDPLTLVLEKDEKVQLHIERNLVPYWAALALVGLGFVAYGLSDPIYGWGVFFLGIVLLSFIGGAVHSVRYHATDKRLLRTGYLGTTSWPLAGAKVERAHGLFGDRVTLKAKDGRQIRIWNVQDGPAIADALARKRA